MPFLGDKELDDALAQFVQQWNIAERRIKKAEQVRANEVVSSAIFELRYAGRKLTDLIGLCLSTDITTDSEARNRAVRYIADAIEDCVKAKHDAIDSMMDFVAVWFDTVEKRLSLTKVIEIFPDYLEKTAMIADVQDLIADSRENRDTRRDEIYDDIEQTNYEQVLELFRRMDLSQDRIQADVDKESRTKGRDRIVLYAGTVLGLIGTAGIIISLFLI